MVVCKYGSCIAGCNQEQVHAILAQVIARYRGFAKIEGNNGDLGGTIVGGVRRRTLVQLLM